MFRRSAAALATVALAAAVPGLGFSAHASPAAPAAKPDRLLNQPGAGSFALSGARAQAYRLPPDVVKINSTTYPDGSKATRYQQMAGRASVLNGQITVFTNADGSRRAVVGAHYAGVQPTNTVRVSSKAALGQALARHGSAGAETSQLRLDPRNGRMFYAVDQIRPASRWVTWVDAETGKVKKSYSALTEGEVTGHGIGVKGDRKAFPTTKRPGQPYLLKNLDQNGVDLLGDSRRTTENAHNTNSLRGNVMADSDNHWNRKRPLYRNSDQRPGVDAHYYAGVVDSYYTAMFGRNSIDDEGMAIRSVVHFSQGYCNAFWNGEQMTYGDGDGESCLPLSGGLDVVGHELTHGVTEFTSDLIYENESGALNESFSDMMGNSMEFYANKRGLDPAARPDWRIGEDVIPSSRGFRNMGDPQEFGDPDYYTERYRGDADNGGVHTNSGIPNHAYYLAVNGGKNAGCGTGSVSGHTHTQGCGRTVEAIGLSNAEQIFYQAFTGLTEYANMCDARNATVALARYRGLNTNLDDAWAAVGVLQGCRVGVPPPPPCQSDGEANLPFGSPHPYGNNADCTWVYDNGQPGFQFRFSLLDTEEGYDYVYVRNENGKYLNVYTGQYPAPTYSDCIRTRKGIVQLESDGSVTAQGFTVTGVRAC